YNNETLNKIGFNPLTRVSLSPSIKRYLEHLEMGWRGYFNMPNKSSNNNIQLFGLFENIPEEKKIKVDIGVVRMIRQNTNLDNSSPLWKEMLDKYNKAKRELVGNLFLVQILFPDGSAEKLFEIALPTIELD